MFLANDASMTLNVAESKVANLVGLLARHRERKGLSQRQLAALAGLNPKTISLWERGKRSPTLVALLLVSAAMDYDLGQNLKEVLAND
ncbi:MAG: helix-turn-helix transcriptional regulator [Prosthecobacter sp.]|jgi:transcriptional regulator with XRE-family HTH domain|uniref:helix-turn-helix transcriptional regulator n=1 Tax=Prosthecobacter sp. TaxID=1965333 RepID=UPI0019F86B61|nr:helix-turn-helix transcriptional regulator [Prosthecobacter sp.]MBE2283587.1 helix-turn-helix transcriptional regulator [Prosthecobacter sp.]